MATYWLFEYMNVPPGLPRRAKREASSVTVGRTPPADVVIDWDGKVSRKHAVFSMALDGRLTLTDLNSTNGTFIRDNFEWRKVTGETPLPSPAAVKLGETLITVSRGEFLDQSDAAIFLSQVIPLPGSLDRQKKLEAILVLDQCNSSTLAENAGEEVALHLKKRLYQICDSAFREVPPAYVKNTGDGFMAVYGNASVCLDTAALIIRILNQRNRMTQNPPIHVRIGLHFGETFRMDNDSQERHGNSVNTAFRIEGVQAAAFEHLQNDLPGENRILASKEFLEAHGNARNGFKPLGPAKLKGIDRPVELFVHNSEAPRA